MLTLTPAAYRDRIRGGWIGKRLGCAVGAPLDGERRAVEVAEAGELLRGARFGEWEGEELQRVWLEELRSGGPGLGADDLARAWLERVRLTRQEYGYARANLRRDLLPPVSGVHDNPFRESLGALARAELWGMLAPGDPAAAAEYAWQEAMLDHAGSGVAAAVVLAGLVSAAFADTSPERLVETALRLVARESRVAQVMRDVARWHGELANWRRTREMLLRSYGSEEVRDSSVALGFITLALLDGEGAPGHSLLTAARCGWSTACVCGAVGAVVGVMHGGAALPEEWVSAAAEPVAELVEHTYEVGRAVVETVCDGRAAVQDDPPEEEPRLVPPEAGALLQRMAMGPYVVSFRRAPLQVFVDYEAVPTIGYDQPRRLGLGIVSEAARDVELRPRFVAPEGFVVVGSFAPITLAEEGTVSFSVTLTAPQGQCDIAPANQCVLFLAIEDEPEVAVPITLLGESIWHAAGPFETFDQAYAPQQPNLLTGERGLREEEWQRLSVAEPAINVLAGLEGEQGTYYLASDFLAGGAMAARLRVGCNDGVRAWLNGTEVLSHHEHRPADPRVSADECDVDFAAGWNRLVIKMAQCSPRRFLSVVVRDREGQLLPDLTNTQPR